MSPAQRARGASLFRRAPPAASSARHRTYSFDTKNTAEPRSRSGRRAGSVHNPGNRRNHRMPSQSELATEFDILMRRAGIKVPDERRAAVLASYADLHEQIALLHN